MNPWRDDFVVVTASRLLGDPTQPKRATTIARCLCSWKDRAAYVWQREIRTSAFGVVPIYARALGHVLQETKASILACLHDDVEILDDGWDAQVLEFFDTHPQVGLVGFGGGRSLGAADIYQTPYNPMQLARGDFISNMVDAEAHGRRVTEPTRVACLDGFSLIGRREFWLGGRQKGGQIYDVPVVETTQERNLFAQMASWGVVHHAYDGMLGCFAKRLGWEVWMLPVSCRHLGGQTAVGDPSYAEWADKTLEYHSATRGVFTGDQAAWENAHRIWYDQFRDVLPIEEVR